MSAPGTPQDIVRVPNLPVGKMVDESGNPTQQELTFRQTLITNLQGLFGPQGMVAPSQTAENITLIQNNQEIDPVTGQEEAGTQTVQPGTIIYNTTNNTLMVGILVGSTVEFKTFTVT